MLSGMLIFTSQACVTCYVKLRSKLYSSKYEPHHYSKMSSLDSSRIRTHLVAFSKKVIRPTGLTIDGFKQVRSRHAKTMNEDKWEWLGDFCWDKVLDIHSSASDRRPILGIVGLTNVKVGAIVQNPQALDAKAEKNDGEYG